MRVARLGLVHHVDVHALAQRLLDRVVHHVEHRDRARLRRGSRARSAPAGPSRRAAEARLARRRRAPGARGPGPRESARSVGGHAVDAPSRCRAPSSISCTRLRSEARSHASRTASVAAWTSGGRRLLGIEPGGADDPLDEIVVEERLDRARVASRSRRARSRAPGAGGRWRTARGRWPRSAAASPCRIRLL